MYLLTLLFTVILNGCVHEKVNLSPESLPDVITSKEKVSFLALGDSYTIGHGEKTDLTFPYLLQDALLNSGIEFNAPPKVIARTGWTCNELFAAIKKDSTLRPPYDIVTLLIGVNDQYRKYNIELYNDRFSALVDKAIVFADNKPEKVIVISIPDYGVTPFGKQRNQAEISSEIDAYNEINKSVSLLKKVKYVNITDISWLAESDSSLLVSDKLHPSGKMYKLWVERILPEAIKALQ